VKNNGTNGEIAAHHPPEYARGDRARHPLSGEKAVAATNTQTLNCGCEVQTSRDFLGRVVGTIVRRAEECSRDGHVTGGVVLMPGRENARSE